MQQYEVYLSPFAETDIKEIFPYHYEENQEFAKKLLEKLKTRVFSLKTFPLKGKIVPELEKQGIIKYRQILEGYYRIIFSVHRSQVYIHAIIDSRRNLEEILLKKLMEISEKQ